MTPLVGMRVEIVVVEESDEPPPTSGLAHRVRVVGRVGAARDNEPVPLHLDTGDTLHLRWAGSPPSPLASMAVRRVAVAAAATLSADGILARLDADGVSPARSGDEFFSRPPQCVGRPAADSDLRQPQTPAAGMAQVFGAWPGDESDDQILRALEEVE